jgi:hypothetical protein
LTDEKTVLSGASSKKEDMERTKQAEVLEEKLKDIDDKAEKFENKGMESSTTLSQLKKGIEAMFSRMNCSKDDLPPGASQAISEENMMHYLAAIETRADELLRLYDSVEDDPDYDPSRTATARPALGATSQPPPRLPSTVEEYSDDEDDEDEDDQRPFTRDELKAKTLKGITKRQKKSRMKGQAQEKA